jgi:uncharacterized membrane protein
MEARIQPAVSRVCLALFLIHSLFFCLCLVLPIPQLAAARWPEELLLLLATAALLSAYSRGLPVQNVLLAAVTIGALGGGIEALSQFTGFPFGRRAFSGTAGVAPFGLPPWTIPLVWIVALLGSRGVARFALRNSREKPDYGFRVLGLTALLSAPPLLGWEVYAVRVGGYWSWPSTAGALNWQGIPWFFWVAWPLAALPVLAVATPSLISKRPVKSPPGCEPLVVWATFSLVFVFGSLSGCL